MMRPDRMADYRSQQGAARDLADTDPARAYPTRQSRRDAFATWQAAGHPWPPPAGLASACTDACIRTERRKW